ncbi:hypothetical protein HK103_002571 [Boothiomyces macroporosus]|uniref:Uncharacterized protein n=1 Tax=Boothiomyces macroporosus TaxID=261099 RepID=A0AAD5U9D7_9FUNG|nr:hypothetical protein HK103_002571 [Boothiomyces macroporosus]
MDKYVLTLNDKIGGVLANNITGNTSFIEWAIGYNDLELLEWALKNEKELKENYFNIYLLDDEDWDRLFKHIYNTLGDEYLEKLKMVREIAIETQRKHPAEKDNLLQYYKEFSLASYRRHHKNIPWNVLSEVERFDDV